MRRLSTLALSTALAAVACGGSTPPPAPPPTPVAPPPAATTPAAAVDRSALPKPAPAPAWAPPAAEMFKLGNGMPVYYLKQGTTPLVTLMLVLPRGSATDPPGKDGLTAVTADMLDEGAGKRGALELNQELHRLATDYGAGADVDNVTLSMSLLADNFEPSVGILADIVRRPTLSAAEFARRKQQHLASALAGEKDPSTARSIVMRRVLFGTAYGGAYANGVQSTLKHITLADVRRQYKDLVQPDGAAFVVVGGIDAEPVKKGLEAAFGDWKGTSKAKDAKLTDSKLAHEIAFVDFPGATQSIVGVVTRAAGEQTPDYFPAKVMNWALGGAFTSRLNLNLREDKGYTYGASSTFVRWQKTGFFGLFANVKSDTTEPSVDQMFKELDGVCGAHPITDKERDEAVGGLLLGFPGRFEHIDGVAGELADLPLYNRPLDFLQKWPEKVKAVDTAAANAVAKKVCDPSQYAVVIAGDLKAVGPSLAPLKLPIVGYDAQGKRVK